MGGGKSRTMCEDVLDDSLDYPGLTTLVCRLRHTAIIETTRKTMLDQVLPHELIARSRESSGEDFVTLHNGSTIHFIGLEDPVRWFSSEIGKLVFDESHEIPEDTVVKLVTRLRQPGMPHTVTLGFNPENPGHWLWRWFIAGALPLYWPDDWPPFYDPRSDRWVEYAGGLMGYRKEAVYASGASVPLGDAEFFLAKATDNIHLPVGYVEQSLAGLPPLLRRRYLEGEWLYVSGQSFFDVEALGVYAKRVGKPAVFAVTSGDPSGRDASDRVRFARQGEGQAAPWWVWEPPVRARVEELEDGRERELPGHRYLVTVDVSSGTANDYSALQVIDVEEFAQVAEYQRHVDLDLVALEAFRAAVVYNGALIAPEVTGGWGFAVAQKLEQLIAGWRGPHSSKPRLYTRRVEDRLRKQWTDRLGWDTTVKSRAAMLNVLEEVLREGEFGLRSQRCLEELGTFVWPKPKDDSGPYKGLPQAQPGANDDLVIALAMGVYLAASMPRQLRRVRQVRHEPQFAATGY